MKLAIMQPYFLPYIGYWQLISSVDTFVIYDNIQYTKKGWFNRNRFLQNGKDVLFSIPLQKDHDYLNVSERFVSPVFDKRKLMAQIQNAYVKAPYQKEIIPFLGDIINYNEENLFKYIYNSVKRICEYLGIDVKIVISSTINIDYSLKAEEKVLAICNALNATTYINAIGGMELYDKEKFKSEGLELKFIKSNSIKYKQFENKFISWLSIVDVLMFNSKDEVKKMIKAYELV
jgi:WbqC-like protein family